MTEQTCEWGGESYCENADHPKVEWAKRMVCALPQDDGTMPANVERLSDAVVGHRIISAERGKVPEYPNSKWMTDGLILTLDNGTKVKLADGSDCCAHTSLEAFLLHPDRVDHVITGVGTEGGFTEWHIFADFGDVLDLTVSWSCGNPFYYGYGFSITVEPAE